MEYLSLQNAGSQKFMHDDLRMVETNITSDISEVSRVYWKILFSQLVSWKKWAFMSFLIKCSCWKMCLLLWSGNKEAREGTARFLCRHSAECSHFIFSNTVCVTTLVYYNAYLAPLALFPCRSVSRRTDKRTVCNRLFDRASWTTSLKTSLSDGPGCWDPEAQLLLSSFRRSETCGTEEKGINEVSLLGACCDMETRVSLLIGLLFVIPFGQSQK